MCFKAAQESVLLSFETHIEMTKKANDDLERLDKLVEAVIPVIKLNWQQAHEIAQLKKQIADLQDHSPRDHVNGA